MHEHDLPLKLKKKQKFAPMKKPPLGYSLYNQDLNEKTMAAGGMEIDGTDGTDGFDFFGDVEKPPFDPGFFNSFEDDFDDADIN